MGKKSVMDYAAELRRRAEIFHRIDAALSERVPRNEEEKQQRHLDKAMAQGMAQVCEMLAKMVEEGKLDGG